MESLHGQLRELVSRQELTLSRFEHTLEEHKHERPELEELVEALQHEEQFNDWSDDFLRSSDLFASASCCSPLSFQQRVFEWSYLLLLKF